MNCFNHDFESPNTTGLSNPIILTKRFSYLPSTSFNAI